MRRLLDWLTRTDDLIRLISHYRQLVDHQQDMLMAKDLEMLRLSVTHTRTIRDMLQNFHDVTDDPALRDTLQAGIDDMSDQLARLEEHAA